MNDQQRYGLDEQWDDLPIPDQDASWQKMKQLLDEDDKDHIPPVFFRSCAGWGLLLLILIIGGVWFTIHNRSQQKDNGNRASNNYHPSTTANHKIQQPGANMIHSESPATINKTTSDSSHTEQLKRTVIPQPATHQENKHSPADRPLIHKNEITQILDYSKRNVLSGKLSHAKQGRNKKRKTLSNISHLSAKNKQTSETFTHEPEKTISWTPQSAPSDMQVTSHADSSKKADSIKHQTPDTKPESKRKNKRTYYFTVGIGEQQQIPLKGQKAVPYNYYGRTGSLSDYIPSVYLRLEHDKKWFIQPEFRYGAPQMVKQLAYSQVSKSDSFRNITTSTLLSVKKTFYHQIPITFNYYIRPNWSVGTGTLYSKFYGAITEQTTKIKNNLTQTESVSRKLIKIPPNTD